MNETEPFSFITSTSEEKKYTRKHSFLSIFKAILVRTLPFPQAMELNTIFKRSIHKQGFFSSSINQSVVWCTLVRSQNQILESDTIKDSPRIFKQNSTVHCRPVK